jgi:hypothetical protein
MHVRRTRRIKCSIEAVAMAVKGKVSFGRVIRGVSAGEQALDAPPLLVRCDEQIV